MSGAVAPWRATPGLPRRDAGSGRNSPRSESRELTDRITGGQLACEPSDERLGWQTCSNSTMQKFPRSALIAISAGARRFPRVWVLIGALLVGLCLAIAFPAWGRRERSPQIVSDTAAIHTALDLYRKEFGDFPAGGSREVSLALQGRNPRGIVFLEFRRRQLSPDGDLLDPWGTPYAIAFVGEQVLIRSAGENRVFDRTDYRGCDDLLY